MKTTISLEQWIEEGRAAVLEALDQFVRVSVAHISARGWVDSELPELFRATDSHLLKIAARVNSGEERGSAFFQIKTEPEPRPGCPYCPFGNIGYTVPCKHCGRCDKTQ